MFEKIFVIAKSKGVQQKDIAEHLGVLPAVVTDWKSGRCKPSVESIYKLADYFGVTTDYLLGRTDERSGNMIKMNENAKIKVKGKNNLAVQQGINNGVFTINNGQQVPLSEEASELLNIYSSLKVKKRMELLQHAYAVLDEQSLKNETEIEPAKEKA